MASGQTGGGLSECRGLAKEGRVSQRNGDKARFGRERKRNILFRKRIREFRKKLEDKPTRSTLAAPESVRLTSLAIAPSG
jgi:hypothetical protein